jgi:hypothetical protein
MLTIDSILLYHKERAKLALQTQTKTWIASYYVKAWLLRLRSSQEIRKVSAKTCFFIAFYSFLFPCQGQSTIEYSESAVESVIHAIPQNILIHDVTPSNKPLEWTGLLHNSAAPPLLSCLPLRGSVRLIHSQYGPSIDGG